MAFLLFFILSQALYFDLFSLGAFESTSIFLFIVRVYGTQHFLFQSYGFSNYLNLGFDLNNVSTKSESLILQAKIEHQNLKLVFLSFFFVDIAATFLAKPQLKLYFYLAILAGIAISTIALLKIFRSITHLPEELKLKKIVFCSRYFLYPLKSLSLWLGLGAVIIHSCEYIYFVNHSFKEEYGANALPAKKIYFFLFCEIAFIVPLIFMNSNQLLFQMAIAGTWWFTVIRGLVNSLILVHFYTDGLAYSRKTNPYSHGLFKFDSLAQNLIK